MLVMWNLTVRSVTHSSWQIIFVVWPLAIALRIVRSPSVSVGPSGTLAATPEGSGDGHPQSVLSTPPGGSNRPERSSCRTPPQLVGASAWSYKATKGLRLRRNLQKFCHGGGYFTALPFAFSASQLPPN